VRELETNDTGGHCPGAITLWLDGLFGWGNKRTNAHG